MTDLVIHGSPLAKYIIDNKLQQNAGLLSEFNRLFPNRTFKHDLSPSYVSTKSPIQNFFIDQILNPDKQPQTLHVGLYCGKKVKSITASTSSVVTASIQPQPSTSMQPRPSTSAACTLTAQLDCLKMGTM